MKALSGLLAFFVALSCLADVEGSPQAPSAKELDDAILALKPLFKTKAKPLPGDWLDVHREPGQSFRQYSFSTPETPEPERGVMYIQLLGDFDLKREEIIRKTEEFLSLFYGIRTKRLSGLPVSIIPAKAKRNGPYGQQILSSYVLDELLPPRTPKDAAYHFAFSSLDLWPGEGWNFVFGQASLRERVGVWSIRRFGDPGKSSEAFHLCLRRTLALAIHEAGHAYSIEHCTAYECAMCGSNSLEESDRGPLLFCPECMAKACWATKTRPPEKFKALKGFFEKNSFREETELCANALEALPKGP